MDVHFGFLYLTLTRHKFKVYIRNKRWQNAYESTILYISYRYWTKNADSFRTNMFRLPPCSRVFIDKLFQRRLQKVNIYFTNLLGLSFFVLW
jgi:hypothetical protein